MNVYTLTLAQYLPSTPVQKFTVSAASPTAVIEYVRTTFDEPGALNPVHVQLRRFVPAVLTVDGEQAEIEVDELLIEAWRREVTTGWYDLLRSKVDALNVSPDE